MATRIGGPPKRRKDSYSKPFQPKVKPEGYQFGRPTDYRPEYCQRAIEFMKQDIRSRHWQGIWRCRSRLAAHRDFGDAVTRGRAARVQALEHKLAHHEARRRRYRCNLRVEECGPRRMAGQVSSRDQGACGDGANV